MWKKEINNSFKLSYPRIPSHVSVGNYYQSQTAGRQVSLPNTEDLFNSDPGIELLAAHRDFLKSEEDLEQKRKFRDEAKEKLQAQWNEIERLEKNLNGNFISLNSFLLSNETKKTRAKAKYQLDVKLIEKRQKEIEGLAQEIIWLKQSKSEVEEEINQLKLYENFLASVLEASNDFPTSNSIVDRYESLVTTKIDLARRQQESLEILEDAKSALSKMTDENNFRLLGMTNTLTSLRDRYQRILGSALRWEKLIHSIKSCALEKFAEINEVKQSCRNIHWLMCKRRGEDPKIGEDDFEGQLVDIKKTLRQLANTRAEAVKNLNKVISSTKGEVSTGS